MRSAMSAPTIAPMLPSPKTMPISTGRQPEVADGVHDERRQGDVAEEVGRSPVQAAIARR